MNQLQRLVLSHIIETHLLKLLVAEVIFNSSFILSKASYYRKLRKNTHEHGGMKEKIHMDMAVKIHAHN